MPIRLMMATAKIVMSTFPKTQLYIWTQSAVFDTLDAVSASVLMSTPSNR
jgi:hypothetical protein